MNRVIPCALLLLLLLPSGCGGVTSDGADAAPTSCALDCGSFGTCDDSSGAESCVCQPGYEGVPCVDIDECATGDEDCDINAECVNEPGGFSCVCNDGWAPSGAACVDIHECDEGTDNCLDEATCANTEGSFTCACPPDTVGDGVTACEPLSFLAIGWNSNDSIINRIGLDGIASSIGTAGVGRLNAMTSYDGVYLAMGDSNSLYSIDPAGPMGALATLVTLVSFPATSSSVRGIAASSTGAVYFANDQGGPDRLWRIDSTVGGGSITAIDIGATGMTGIQGLAFSPDGTLYAYDVGQGLLTVDTDTGEATRVNPAAAVIFGLQTIAFSADGRLFATQNALYEIDPTTAEATLLGTDMSTPDIRGLVVELP